MVSGNRYCKSAKSWARMMKVAWVVEALEAVSLEQRFKSNASWCKRRVARPGGSGGYGQEGKQAGRGIDPNASSTHSFALYSILDDEAGSYIRVAGVHAPSVLSSLFTIGSLVLPHLSTACILPNSGSRILRVRLQALGRTSRVLKLAERGRVLGPATRSGDSELHWDEETGSQRHGGPKSYEGGGGGHGEEDDRRGDESQCEGESIQRWRRRMKSRMAEVSEGYSEEGKQGRRSVGGSSSFW
ncbi:hypothetical protein FB45DRAFT_176812 [Roridomyces roridus]|uniref:Uncharacterized protein n=1 Tax=Roridomyces roridus TaxID=1738132 RepID=A0AAD7FZC6_9AGAR|nr:hypothetical protein FB45DRAFT_176812 [Roridomyces roridus]